MQASKNYPLQFLASGLSKSRGVAILVSDKVNFTPLKSQSDQEGCYVFVKGTIDLETITIASIYTPNSGQVGFFRDTLTKLKLFQEGSVVIGIDLNYAVDKSLDIKRSHLKNSPKKSKSVGPSIITQILSTYNLVDVWRFFNISDKSYTSFSSTHQTYSRIDYLFVSSDLIPLIE